MILVAFACLLSISANASRINILVPAYANPCCGDGAQMWSSLVATAAGNRNFALEVIFNPASGPGFARDPNYLDATGNGPLRDLRLAGGLIDGYIPTASATRPIADVKADINAYLTGIYAGSVSGLFFDEMSNDLGNVGYYRQLKDYIQSIRPGIRTVGNPGTGYINNVTGQSNYSVADYIALFDTLVTFENTGATYMAGNPSLSQFQGLGSTKIAHIVHTVAPWDASLIATAAGRGAGYLYLTNRPMPDPYDQMPYNWLQFVAGVQAFDVANEQTPNSADVPALPAEALLLLGLALLTMMQFRHVRRWGSTRPN
jgi:hypothetical protein